MRFAFTADIHLSRYGQDKLEKYSNLPERLSSINNALRSMAEYCLSNDVYTLVIGGDVMHGKSIIYSIAQKILLDFIHQYKGKLELWFITGNHDLSGKGANAISSLEFLNYFSSDIIPMNAINGYKRFGDIGTLLVPYSHQMVDIIKTNKHNDQILISHFGLNEGVLNSGLSIIADVGLKDLIGKYKLVLLGHYHKPQEIITDDISVYYAGSLIQLDWGEKNDLKRFLIVDTDDLSVESIPTVGYAKHIEFEINPDNFAQTIKKAEKFQNIGHHIKLIKTESMDTKDIDKNFVVIDKTEKDITNRGISTSMSDEDILKRFLEIWEIDDSEHKEYLEVAKEIDQKEI